MLESMKDELKKTKKALMNSKEKENKNDIKLKELVKNTGETEE